MKKIISALLCIMLALTALVSCGEDLIGEYLSEYEAPVEKEKLTLNLYIVYEEGTDNNALVTVQQRIADYTTTKFETTVNVKYCTADEYESTILSKAASTGNDFADIFLVTSASMMDKVLANGYAADLTEYFNGKEYGTLNARIASALLSKSTVTVDEQTKYFCVPNNHVVAEYEYVLIKKDVAKKYYIGSADQLAYYNTPERLEELRAVMGEDYNEVNVKILKSGYNYSEEGYACNILKYPTISRDYALRSAFVVNSKTKDTARAMEIVYALNTDVELHNYLLYGIPGTNYSYDEETGTVTRLENLESNSNYFMNPLYTGDMFISYYCDDFGWNEQAKLYGDTQNKEAIPEE